MERKDAKELIAIDGNSLMHRAYYALPSMTTREGFPTGALHGFLSMLLKLAERKPDYLVVAFDMHGPTFRHEQFKAYKAGRRETPEDLRAQFPVLKQLLNQMGIAVCETPRYEADDILGTFSRICEESGVDALLVTGDRDALQLIGEHTRVLMTKKGISDTVEFDLALLKEQYGLEPERMRDLKGLMGDHSDNIPGVPGVGEKTALKLLEDFGTIEGVLAHADEIKGKLGEKIKEFSGSARMSYELGTICTSAPISFTLEACRCRPEAFSGGRETLVSLEMRGIASRLPGGFASADEPVADNRRFAERIVLSSAEQIRSALGSLRADQTFALDAGETITFALNEDAYYEIEQGADLFSAPIEEKDLWNAMRAIFEGEGRFILTFDSKRLRHLLDPFGIELRAGVFDAMIADYLLDATRPASAFAALCERFDPKAKPNASMLFRMRREMTQSLRDAGMTKLYEEMELPLASVLFDMEKTGFRVDEAILKELQARFNEQSEALAGRIYALTGETFNILSPKQLGEVLFVRLGLPTGRKNKSGYSTDADTLENLRDRHPAVPLILEYRFITKLKSTFVDGLLAVRGEDGRVRTQFNQCVTATGRISSTEPNMQNIPVRTEQGKEIRKAFVASKGCVLVDADYSQIELRLLAHISGDEGMIAAFNGGKDIHRTTASEVFGVPFETVTSEQRGAAKAVNFGIVYGISDFGLAHNLDIPVRRAADYIRLYFERYPRVKAYLAESVESAKREGYAKTMFDRRRAMTELKSSNYNTRSFGERVAMNMPIQGTAADIIKLAMVRVFQQLRKRGLKTKLILQVHDELIFDTPTEERDEVVLLVHDCMEQVAKLRVPLDADVKVGASWYDTK